MNFRFYIFGESSGYKQYPEDSRLFKPFYQNQSAASLLSIKREEDLVYYVYTHCIDKKSSSFLGFCVVFNGICVKETMSFFPIFEKLYSDCLLSGKFFKMEKDGRIIFGTDSFGSQQEEYDRLSTVLNMEFERKNLFTSIPKTYKTGQGLKQFSCNDSQDLIRNAINIYETVIIVKDNNNNNNGTDFGDKDNSERNLWLYLLLLFLVLLCGWIGYGLYNIYSKDEYNVEDSQNLVYVEDKVLSLSELDKVDVTLSRISIIGNSYRDIPTIYEERMIALKHILAVHIVTSNHDVNSFKMAYSLRKPELSTEQQEALDWFFNQDSTMLDIWSKSKDGANSIGELKQKMETIIKQHGK